MAIVETPQDSIARGVGDGLNDPRRMAGPGFRNANQAIQITGLTIAI